MASQRVRIHTNFKVVVIRQRILNGLHQRRGSQNLLCHLVHSRLDRGAVILGEGLKGDGAGGFPGSSELLEVRLDLGQASEAAPLPVGRNIGAENTVPGLLEGGVLVAEEAPELGAGALQHGETIDGGVDINTLALNDVDLNVAGLGARLNERVRVRLAVNVHAHPSVGHDLNVSRVNVAVLLDKVCTQD